MPSSPSSSPSPSEVRLAAEVSELRARLDAAERRLADARAESAFLYGALEHLPVGLELYGPDGTALWLNRAMVEFVGLPSAEVAVGRFNVLTDPFSVQTGMVDWYRRAYAGELVRTEEFSIDLELARIDWGTTPKRICFRMVLAPQRGADGAVERVLAIMYEVTQQHLVRRISERVIHSGSEVEACRHIADGLVGEMSIAVATLWLYRSGGEGVYAAAHAQEGTHAPGDAPPAGDAAGPSAPDWLAEAEATRGTLVRERRAGAERAPLGLVVTVVAPILGPQGPIGFIEVGATTRYPSEQALPTALQRLAEQYAQFDARYRAQRTFEAVFSRTPDAVALLSASGEVRFANESAQRLFGDRATHVDRMFVEPATVHDLIARAVACADASTPLRSDVQALARDDRAFTAEVAFSRVAVAPGAAGSGIALVARDLTERNAMQASLERSLREKDTLLREVHHRVKNNLQIVSSLLAMQADGLDDAVSGRALASSVERVFAMSLVHQHLYDGDNFERIDLGGYTRGLVGRLRATAGQPARLAFDFDLEEVWVGLDQAVPLGLLLHELLTNAIKHGGDADGAGRISLGLHRSASGFSLSIADRGSTPLSSDAPLRSLGLQLVRALCRQLAARLVIDARTDGPGTRVTVHVPG